MPAPNTFKLLIAGLAIISSNVVYADQVVSNNNVHIVDGNNLTINGRTIALYAIKAPELGTFCDAKRQKYDCGLIARSSLADMSAGAKIICNPAPAPHNKDKFICLSNGYDLSEGMVYTGWAKPLDSAPRHFKKLAREAKDKRHGMWRISLK